MQTKTLIFLFISIIFLGWIAVVISGKTSFNPLIYLTPFEFMILQVLEIPIVLIIIMIILYKVVRN